MTTLQRYKPIPELHELNPGYVAGWKFDCLILQAQPDDMVSKSLIAPEGFKKDEAGASVVARIVAMSPMAFRHGDWPRDLPPPYKVGDIVLTRRYPAGADVKGADGRDYKMVKDEEIIGLQIPEAWAPKREAA